MIDESWLRSAASCAGVALAEEQAGAYMVGGCLRDRLLGRPVADVDLAIAGDPIDLGRRIAQMAGGTAVLLGDVPPLVRVAGPGGSHLDLLQVRGGSIEADLALRDLTINAMAADLSQVTLDWLFSDGAQSPEGSAGLIDPFGGRRDLTAGVVRGVAEVAFTDDPLRLLRAVRFRAELGFTIDEQTVEWMRRSAGLATRPAPERIRDELLRLLAPDGADRQLRFLRSLGILNLLFPELQAGDGLDRAIGTVAATERVVAWLGGAPAPGWLDVSGVLSESIRAFLGASPGGGTAHRVLVKLAALLYGLGAPADRRSGAAPFSSPLDAVVQRLRLSAREAALMRTVASVAGVPRQMSLKGHSRRDAYRFFRATGDCAVEVLIVSLADHLAGHGPGLEADAWRCHASLTVELLGAFLVTPDEFVRPPRLLTGEDVMSVALLPAGPAVARALEALREAQAAGEVRTRAEAITLARGMRV